jgi:hypothetical protein
MLKQERNANVRCFIPCVKHKDSIAQWLVVCAVGLGADWTCAWGKLIDAAYTLC